RGRDVRLDPSGGRLETRDRDVRAARIGDPVRVDVLLPGIRDRRAVVARVADTVRVAVLLARVRDARAIVLSVAYAVAVAVRAGRACVAGVADPVVVLVGLGGIGDRG